MNLTLETDYAVRIVSEMAAAQNSDSARMDASGISERTGVPPRFALKILRKLVGVGIARSYKGSGGGYELARPASEITLCDVVEATEGEFSLSRCQGDHTLCSHPGSAGVCRFRPEFERVSKLVREELAKTDFSQRK